MKSLAVGAMGRLEAAGATAPVVVASRAEACCSGARSSLAPQLWSRAKVPSSFSRGQKSASGDSQHRSAVQFLTAEAFLQRQKEEEEQEELKKQAAFVQTLDGALGPTCSCAEAHDSVQRLLSAKRCLRDSTQPGQPLLVLRVGRSRWLASEGDLLCSSSHIRCPLAATFHVAVLRTVLVAFRAHRGASAR